MSCAPSLRTVASLWDGGFGVAISFYKDGGIKIELPLNLYCTSNWSICLGGGFKWPMSHGTNTVRSTRPVVSNVFKIFTPTWGFMLQFDEHIFQMGWFNHQSVVLFL